jgi:hypothetical protein
MTMQEKKQVQTIGDVIESLVAIVNDPETGLTMQSPIRGGALDYSDESTNLFLQIESRLIVVDTEETDESETEDGVEVAGIVTYEAGIAVTFE